MGDTYNRDIQYDGAWLNTPDDPVYFGIILIYSRLSVPEKWATYWHELDHAINDIMAWDRPIPLNV